MTTDHIFNLQINIQYYGRTLTFDLGNSGFPLPWTLGYIAVNYLKIEADMQDSNLRPHGPISYV